MIEHAEDVEAVEAKRHPIDAGQPIQRTRLLVPWHSRTNLGLAVNVPAASGRQAARGYRRQNEHFDSNAA